MTKSTPRADADPSTANWLADFCSAASLAAGHLESKQPKLSERLMNGVRAAIDSMVWPPAAVVSPTQPTNDEDVSDRYDFGYKHGWKDGYEHRSAAVSPRGMVEVEPGLYTKAVVSPTPADYEMRDEALADFADSLKSQWVIQGGRDAFGSDIEGVEAHEIIESILRVVRSAVVSPTHDEATKFQVKDVINAPELIQRLARFFAMEYLTSHFRELQEDEQPQYEQLAVTMLAFAAQVKRLVSVTS